MINAYVFVINNQPFPELAKLVELSQDEDEHKESTDNGCDGYVVVPLLKGVNHISGAKILELK